ncbi:MAG: hypothetical protein K2I25_00665, partial [Muribaculaceae bacterium]|nr:hypothetical protein [Muribaculaceae bacterium]
HPEDVLRPAQECRGLGVVYKRQLLKLLQQRLPKLPQQNNLNIRVYYKEDDVNVILFLFVGKRPTFDKRF